MNWLVRSANTLLLVAVLAALPAASAFAGAGGCCFCSCIDGGQGVDFCVGELMSQNQCNSACTAAGTGQCNGAVLNGTLCSEIPDSCGAEAQSASTMAPAASGFGLALLASALAASGVLTIRRRSK